MIDAKTCWVKAVPIGLLVAIVIAFGAPAVMAEEQDSSAMTLDDLAWLAGHWRGEGFGGVCDEIWYPAEAGSMMGTFRLAHGEQVAFYEFMTITIEDGRPILRLKHFNADMTGWEDKDEVITFTFEHAKPREIGFDGLTYRLTGEDALTIVVHTEGHGETVLNCVRVAAEN